MSIQEELKEEVSRLSEVLGTNQNLEEGDILSLFILSVIEEEQS